MNCATSTKEALKKDRLLAGQNKVSLSLPHGSDAVTALPTAAIGGNFNSNIARTSQRKRIPSVDNLQALR